MGFCPIQLIRPTFIAFRSREVDVEPEGFTAVMRAMGWMSWMGWGMALLTMTLVNASVGVHRTRSRQRAAW